MAITYVTTAKAASGSGTTTCNKPTGTIDGDLMIAVVISAENITSAPSGWTAMGSQTPGYRFKTYYKVASSEGASYSWNSYGWFAVFITTYRGVDTTSPVYAQKMNQTEGNNNQINAGTWSVGAVDKTILAIGMQGGSSTVTFTKSDTPISGWTEDFDSNSDAYTCQFARVKWTSSGSFNYCATTMSTSRASINKMMQMVALTEAASGPANLKSYNTNLKANIKTINGNPIANCKSLNGNV